MATPHIGASAGQIAETVLLPGDPLRAKFVAEEFLDDVECVNEVRNMLGYTGIWQGQRLSVMSSGMGMPSMSIYATELFQSYGVRRIIRMGSCGSIHPDINLGDLVVAMGASTDSSMNRLRFSGHDFAAIADYALMQCWISAAEAAGVRYRVGNVFTSDTFYHPSNDIYGVAAKLGIFAVEMEAAALYRVAAEQGGQALAVMTVSDHILKEERLTAAERETTFGDMMQVTLDSLQAKQS